VEWKGTRSEILPAPELAHYLPRSRQPKSALQIGQHIRLETRKRLRHARLEDSAADANANPLLIRRQLSHLLLSHLLRKTRGRLRDIQIPHHRQSLRLGCSGLQHPEVGLNDLVGWHPHGGFDLDHLVHFRARRPGRGNRESGGPSPSTGLNRSSRWETWRSRSSAARCARVSRGKRGCRRLFCRMASVCAGRPQRCGGATSQSSP
jgi:hypothetical protein